MGNAGWYFPASAISKLWGAILGLLTAVPRRSGVLVRVFLVLVRAASQSELSLGDESECSKAASLVTSFDSVFAVLQQPIDTLIRCRRHAPPARCLILSLEHELDFFGRTVSVDEGGAGGCASGIQ